MFFLLQDTLEAGSAAKIVDCILALKSYHEGKQCNGGNGPWKLAKSPVVPQSAGRMQSHTISLSSVSCRHLDMSTTSKKQKSMQNENQKSEGLFFLKNAIHLFEYFIVNMTLGISL